MPAPVPLVADSAARHGIAQQGGLRVFVKSATDEESRSDLRREAGVLARLGGASAPLWAPRLVEWSETRGTLSTEVVEGVDLATRARSAGILEPVAGSALGTALAVLHREYRALADEVGPAQSGPVGVHRPTPQGMRRLSAGAMDALVFLQRSRSLCTHLDRLCVPPDEVTLIHGDVRLENVMVGPSGLALVDWEHAGAGEGLWDVAFAMAWCFSAWLSSIPQIPGVPPDQLTDEALIPLAAMRPGVGELWRAYREGASDDPRAALDRCLDLVAVRLVQLGVEAVADSEDMRAVTATHFQLADNILRSPAALCPRLLGFALDDA